MERAGTHLFDQLGQGGTTEVTHGEIYDVARSSDSIDRDDVGVFESRGRSRLVRETFHKTRVTGVRERQHFERHIPTEILLLRPEDGSHAAPADDFSNVVDVVKCFPNEF